jgi:hypothetical protein
VFMRASDRDVVWLLALKFCSLILWGSFGRTECNAEYNIAAFLYERSQQKQFRRISRQIQCRRRSRLSILFRMPRASCCKHSAHTSCTFKPCVATLDYLQCLTWSTKRAS